MHQDIPLIEIKNFHLGYYDGPVFLSSGHDVGIILFKLHDINFAVHLSVIGLQFKIIFFFKVDDIMINYPNAPVILPYIYFLLWFNTRN